MPVFVHLTRHDNLPAIRRNGIAPAKWSKRVYAMPVTRNFQISHQWLRELRRGRGGTMVAVYFRVPDDEPVEIGHYSSPHRDVTAAEAVAIMLSVENADPVAARAADKSDRNRKTISSGRRLPASPEGYQVLLGRRIQPSEILQVKAPPQVIGWRYQPGSNGMPPCTCICCAKGVWGVGKLLRAVEEAEAAGRPTKIIMGGREDSSYHRVERLKAARAKPTQPD
jgi:hypothetical protein